MARAGRARQSGLEAPGHWGCLEDRQDSVAGVAHHQIVEAVAGAESESQLGSTPPEEIVVVTGFGPL